MPGLLEDTVGNFVAGLGTPAGQSALAFGALGGPTASLALGAGNRLLHGRRYHDQ